MKSAKSTVDGREWNVAQFHPKHPERPTVSRRNLVCIACGAPAVFRSGSDNRSSSFAAQHRDYCVAVAPTSAVFRYLQ
ncbi:hypothetical protein F8G81_10405 [Arthrobacter sp. CDRTa11]|uniref:hypothetical protein n=1 Tax=Arthrobacter sp. CDRTa11 TaxID=2651199 RepID=UPI002265CEA0|nr:hypothetical protein [Arthrobacter sp. CDRTa11]UZX02968.1 hypothetical protein F8G81_10405 [Arthrobacter sp. CDRTa11]